MNSISSLYLPGDHVRRRYPRPHLDPCGHQPRPLQVHLLAEALQLLRVWAPLQWGDEEASQEPAGAGYDWGGHGTENGAGTEAGIGRGGGRGRGGSFWVLPVAKSTSQNAAALKNNETSVFAGAKVGAGIEAGARRGRYNAGLLSLAKPPSQATAAIQLFLLVVSWGIGRDLVAGEGCHWAAAATSGGGRGGPGPGRDSRLKRISKGIHW